MKSAALVVASSRPWRRSHVALADRPESKTDRCTRSNSDLIEAAARSGRLDDLGDQLERSAEWAHRVSAPPRLSLLARCRALVDASDQREQFEVALSYAAALFPFQLARTELLYGEWLRRQREALEARASPEIC
jgi:hypothetical protein